MLDAIHPCNVIGGLVLLHYASEMEPTELNATHRCNLFIYSIEQAIYTRLSMDTP
jgi:hypothetical protein